LQNLGMTDSTIPTQVPAPIRHQHLDGLAMLILLACCLFWGFQQVMVKATIAEVPTVMQAGIRFCGAAVLVLLWCAWRGKKLFPQPLSQDASWWPGLLAGMLFTAEFAFLQLGLLHIPASRLTVFLYTAPFWVAAIVPLLVTAERLRVAQWAGMGLAFVAVVYALKDHLVQGVVAQPMLGDVLSLAAGACWGLTTVVIRTTALGKAGAEKILFYQVAISGLGLMLMSGLLGERWPDSLSVFAWVSLSLQVVVGGFASFLVWMWLLGRYPATKLSSFVFLTPVFALLTGSIWLQEPVTPGLLLALVGVGVGIVLVNRPK
jgi:drug/metabolite transporter (DMT)-like permease